MNKRILLYVSLMALGLYAIPNTVALFQGMHSFIGGSDVSCLTCHGNVGIEVGMSTANKHTLAANNSNYTTYLALGGVGYYTSNSTIKDIYGGSWTYNAGVWDNGTTTRLVKLDRNNNNSIEGDEVCRLCHDVALAGLEAHAAIVRTCDDDRCHSNKNYNYNRPAFFSGSSDKITAVGYNLTQGEIHRNFYIASSNDSSSYPAGTPFGHLPGNADPGGLFLSRGFYTCVTCHTDAGQGATVPPKQLFNHSDPNQPKGRY